MLNVAAIDVGSNAMRMVVGVVDESWRVSTLESVRLPIRLGQDVFSKGFLEEKTIQQTEDAFLRFKHVARSFDVQRLRAVATSAVREARNRDLLLDRVLRSSGIEIEVISGEEEARLIHLAVIRELNLKDKRSTIALHAPGGVPADKRSTIASHAPGGGPVDKPTLLVDIGGGSVEVTIFTGRNIISTDSYGMGTVRLLERLDPDHTSSRHFGKLVRQYADAVRDRIERDLGDQKIQLCAGTGGNVEEIGRLRQKLFKAESGRCIALEELEILIERLDRMSYEERMRKFKLRADRADVILPAAVVLHMIAREAGVKHIAIPNVGLKDGLLLDIAGDLSGSLHLRHMN